MESGPKTVLEIAGMTDQASVDKVRNALHGVTGVVTESVGVGTATIRASKPDQCRAACAAVSALGFEATEAHDGAKRPEHKGHTPPATTQPVPKGVTTHDKPRAPAPGATGEKTRK